MHIVKFINIFPDHLIFYSLIRISKNHCCIYVAFFAEKYVTKNMDLYTKVADQMRGKSTLVRIDC